MNKKLFVSVIGALLVLAMTACTINVPFVGPVQFGLEPTVTTIASATGIPGVLATVILTPTLTAATAAAPATTLPAVASSATPACTYPCAPTFGAPPTSTPAAPAATLTPAVPATSTPTPAATQTPWVITATLAASPTPPLGTTGPAATPPAATPTVVPPITSTTCGSTDPKSFEYFQCFTAGFVTPELHGALIDRLDALYLGVTRDFDGGTITTTNDVVALWMGDYVTTDPTQGGLLTKYLVDGDTGLWLVKPNTTVSIPVGFAYVRLQNWTGEVSPRAGTPALAKGSVQANGCVANASVVPTIQRMLGQEPLFAELDKVANSNPDARLRNGWYATVKALAGKSMIWTKTGMVGLGWAPITTADGKTLYVAKMTADLEIMYPFSGLQVCDPYPGYNSLPSVTASAAPVETKQGVANTELARLINTYRQTDHLYAALGLLPSATHPAGKAETKWNTFVITSGNVAGTNLVPVDFFNTADGFRAVYFVSTDGESTFEASWAVVELKDGAFSPADSFPWWGTP